MSAAEELLNKLKNNFKNECNFANALTELEKSVQARQAARKADSRRASADSESKMSRERAMAESCQSLLEQKAPILQDLGLPKSARNFSEIKDLKDKMTHREMALEQHIPKIEAKIANGSGEYLNKYEELLKCNIQLNQGKVELTKNGKKQILS